MKKLKEDEKKNEKLHKVERIYGEEYIKAEIQIKYNSLYDENKLGSSVENYRIIFLQFK